MAAKRIYRSQREKIIGGVCAGIADYFNVDVAWIRLAFVLAVFADGLGVVVYLIAWIVFPREEPQPAPEQVRPLQATGDSAGSRPTRAAAGPRNVVGIILVVLGLLFFFDRNFYWFRFDAYWPIILVALGLFLILKSAAAPDEVRSARVAPAGPTEAPGQPADPTDGRGGRA